MMVSNVLTIFSFSGSILRVHKYHGGQPIRVTGLAGAGAVPEGVCAAGGGAGQAPS